VGAGLYIGGLAATSLARFVGGGEGAGLHASSHEDVAGGDGAGLYAGNSPSSSAQCGSWKLRWCHCKPAAPDIGAVGVAGVKLRESAKLHAGRLAPSSSSNCTVASVVHGDGGTLHAEFVMERVPACTPGDSDVR
jgi:hypothetical protein